MTRSDTRRGMERIVVPVTSIEAADAVSDLARRSATEVVAVAVDAARVLDLASGD
jgi:hypothetical protein